MDSAVATPAPMLGAAARIGMNFRQLSLLGLIAAETGGDGWTVDGINAWCARHRQDRRVVYVELPSLEGAGLVDVDRGVDGSGQTRLRITPKGAAARAKALAALFPEATRPTLAVSGAAIRALDALKAADPAADGDYARVMRLGAHLRTLNHPAADQAAALLAGLAAQLVREGAS